MPRLRTDNHQNVTGYLYAILKGQGRDFTKCELCGSAIPEGKAKLHHTKYKGATIKDIMIVCNKCNTKTENKGLA